MPSTTHRLATARVFLNKICLVAVALSITGIMDGLISTSRKPDTRIGLVQGTSTEIIGRFYGMTQTVSDLSVVSSSPDITLAFQPEAFKGFWLGEDMWRATISAKAGMEPGLHTLKITYSDLSNIKDKDRSAVDKLSSFQIRTYTDALSLRQDDVSLITRFLGISPWAVFAVFFPCVVLCGALVFFISSTLDVHMAAEGKAEVYRVSKHAERLEIFFGLGKKHGLEKGDWLMVFNDQGKGITRVQIESLGLENSSAMAGLHDSIRPGCLVSHITHP